MHLVLHHAEEWRVNALFQQEYAVKAGAVGAGCHIFEGLKRGADCPAHTQHQHIHQPFHYDSIQHDF
jgi:hypothetical protein